MQKILGGIAVIGAGLIGGSLLGIAPAHAMLAAFDGGFNGTDPLGVSWRAINSGSVGSWGEPGSGGSEAFNPAGFTAPDNDPTANGFDFSIVSGVDGAISTATGGCGGPADATRFCDVTTGVSWTATFLNGDQEVDFRAPADVRIDPGDQFLVEVVFTGPASQASFSFAALWDDPIGVPEPAALSVLGLGALGLLAARRRRA